MQDSHSSPVKFLRLSRVQEATGLGRSAIYDRLDRKSPRYDPTFPKQVRLSQGNPQRRSAVAFVEAEVQAWILDRLHASRRGAQNDEVGPVSIEQEGTPRPTIRKVSLGLSSSYLPSEAPEGPRPPRSKKGASRSWSASEMHTWLEQQPSKGVHE